METLRALLEKMDIPPGRADKDDFGYPRYTLEEAMADWELVYTLSDAMAEFGVPVPDLALWRANLTPRPFDPWGPSEEDEAEAARAKRAESGIPSRYVDVPANPKYMPGLARGRGLYLSGPVGVGKTWAACAMARAWSDSGRDFLFTSSLDLLSRIRSTFDGGESEEAVMRRYAGVPLLVIDDLGKEAPTAWVLSKLFDVINKRYEFELPTIYTSQHKLSELGDAIKGSGDREVAYAIVSRIAGTCEKRSLTGEDRRRSQ